MTIVVFSPRDAAFARTLAARAASLSDRPVRHFTVEPEAETPAAVDGAALTWGGERLDQAQAAFITGFRYEDPILPPPSLEADWSFWQCRHVLRQQSYSFCWSFFSRLEAAGVRFYNPPSALLRAFSRDRPIDILRRAGLPAVPVTVTNDPQVAETVQARHEAVVWRPITGRAAWQIFRDKQRRHLVGPDRPPIMLAPVVPGLLLRLYVIDGRVALALTAAPPAREGVERFELIRSIDPAGVAGVEAIERAAQTLGLRWAVFTGVAGDDRVTIYDVDPDPAVDDLPPGMRAHLAEALACALTGRPRPAPPADAQEPRETLLLRRMLVIQFEMEATKHAPD